jgi:prevent-host-death family protein
LQDAKVTLSRVIKRARVDGPQDITQHGRSVAMLVSHKTHGQLTSNRQSLAGFLMASPLLGMQDLELERYQSSTREVDL